MDREQTAMTHRPKVCDVCGAPTQVAHNTDIYGKWVGSHEWFIQCTDPQCGAFAETWPHSRVTFKKMATPQTRRARRMLHGIFDPLWKTREQRTLAYTWLAEKMGLPRKECHIGLFSVEQCQQAILLVEKYRPVFPEVGEKRFERRNLDVPAN